MVRESETVRFRGEQCYQAFEGSLPLHIHLIVNGFALIFALFNKLRLLVKK